MTEAGIQKTFDFPTVTSSSTEQSLTKVQAGRIDRYLRPPEAPILVANTVQGLPADARDYAAAAQIIGLPGIRSIALLTNNPDKLEKLTGEGVVIERRIPLVIPPNDHDREYLDTKRERMGHLI